MEFLPLHTIPAYFKECAELLNEEWKRSLNARLHSLEKSCDTLPICLVLLERGQSGSSSVVGHSRLSDVRGQTNKSCLVESVVVKKNLRGKGYGRIVMEKTEQFAASKGYKTMYLTTHDKQDFYRHLGYEFCSPIVCFDSSLVPEHLAQQLLGNMTLSNAKSAKSDSSSKTTVSNSQSNSQDSDKNGKSNGSVNPSRNQDNPEAPLAPPLPPVVPPTQPLAPPIAPPPPMAPPPPAVSSASQDKKRTSGQNDKTVVRWDPNMVSWMKKDLTLP